MHTSPELAADNRPLPAGVHSKRLSRKKTRSTGNNPNTPANGLSGVVVRRVSRKPAHYARFFAAVFLAAVFLAAGLLFAAAGAFFFSGGRIADS
jgi:hypothetical protein